MSLELFQMLNDSFITNYDFGMRLLSKQDLLRATIA